jgi:hypothetical protein
VFRKDCGATTNYVTGVAIRSADDAFVDRSQDVMMIVNGIVSINQTWATENEIRLKLPAFAPIFRHTGRWNEIKITVEQ